MNLRLFAYLVTVVMALQSIQLMGQDQVSPAFTKEWKAEIVDLPGSGFEGMIQDSFGFLWIGTADGLVKYDGHRTEIFVHDPDNSKTLSSNDISELSLEDERYLWIGTYKNGGLNRMDLTSGCITHYLDSASVTEIIKDDAGYI